MDKSTSQHVNQLLSVRVPATSANLGPGFDCMGMALDLCNTFELYQAEARNGITVESRGEGADALPNDKSHLLVRTMIDELTMRMPFDVRHAHYHIVCHNAVPVGSGLGSSSTATLAGLIFANALLDPAGFQNEMGQQRILARAFEVEGHGDNVAPALLGGLVLVTASDGHVMTARVPMPPMQAVVCVPLFHFLTSHARSVLPQHYPRADAVFNMARALLVSEAFRAGDFDLLARAMDDHIHEPFRLPAIPGALQAKEAALEAGAAAVCLSGAGPGLIAFSPDHHAQIGEAMRRGFAEFGLTARAWVLAVTAQGAQVTMQP
jgi:homoserine kinase